MNLFFKLLLAVWFLLLASEMSAQDSTAVNEKPSYYYKVLGQIKVGMVSPVAYGSSFMAQGYDVNNGLDIEGQVRLRSSILVGAKFQNFSGSVTNVSVVGPLERGRYTQLYVTGGYRFLKERSNWNMESNLGIGWVGLQSEFNENPFTDDGTALMANLSVSYRVGLWIGFYASVQHSWFFWNFKIPQELDSLFGNSTVFLPSIGVKFYLL